MRTVVLGLAVSIVLVTTCAADFATKIMMQDKRLALMRDGFREDGVRNIELIANLINAKRVCGDEYFPGLSVRDAVSLLAQKSDIPRMILQREAEAFAEIEYVTLRNNTREALAFCAEIKAAEKKNETKR